MAKLEEYREPVLCLFQEHLVALVSVVLIWWIWLYNPVTVDENEEELENIELELERQIIEAGAGQNDTMAPVTSSVEAGECQTIHQTRKVNGNIITRREKSPRRQ
jgi:hypothetical protein